LNSVTEPGQPNAAEVLVPVEPLREPGEFFSKSMTFEDRPVTFFGYQGDYFFDNVEAHLHAATLVLQEIRKLPADAVVLDVGGNVGTTVWPAAVLPERSRVIAVEPSPKAQACLDAMIAENGLQNVQVVRKAAGARRGRLKLAETEFLAGSFIQSDQSIKGALGAIAVPVTTVDAIVRDLKLTRLDLLKIDVEGFEEHVLKGALKTLARFKPTVVMEFGSFAIVTNRNGSPLDLARMVLKIAPEFNALMPWGFVRVHDEASLRDFLFANMKYSAQDIVFKPS
jgi:FkbM family methyltransferase